MSLTHTIPKEYLDHKVDMPTRFIKDREGRFWDTQIHPKVLKAQQNASGVSERQGAVTGFTFASVDELRRAREEI